jgi:mRNA-degrading endonuclease RelE of RelBE toxin-antitoxin system
MAYRIELTPEARDHLDDLEPGQRARLLDEIAVQLSHEPDMQTRNRAPLRPNPLAQFRLRVGELRAYYDVAAGERLVLVKAIGIKRRNRVVVGGVEIEL